MVLSNRVRGTLYAVFGVLLLTPDSLLLRKVGGVPTFTVMFYRFAIFATAMLTGLCLAHRGGIVGKFRALGKWGVLAGLVLGHSNLFITIAFQQTAIANVLVINASNPIFSALLSRLLLGEVLPLRTLVCAAVCIGAIVLIFAGEVQNGGDPTGLYYSVATAVTFGTYFVVLRYISVYLE
jgi:drug/metabolite transporter (DMT)-like permease